MPSHYLNQCWLIVKWTPRNKFQRTLNHNSNIFMQENGFENVWKMSAILSRPQCVNPCLVIIRRPWFNIKKSSYQYRKSNYGDKTILRPSYLHNGISYTGKTTSLYWIRALVWCGLHNDVLAFLLGVFLSPHVSILSKLQSWGLLLIRYPSQNHMNSNLAKVYWSISSISVAQSFWNFAHCRAVSLPCSMQNL